MNRCRAMLTSSNRVLRMGLQHNATVLFAMIYKYVPRETIAWGDVWVGGFVTAFLFTAGKWVIVIYLGKKGPVWPNPVIEQ
jgi:membrane protein